MSKQCFECSGFGEIDCVYCSASGIDETGEDYCFECNGVGTKECASCNGTGEYEDSEDETNE